MIMHLLQMSFYFDYYQLNPDGETYRGIAIGSTKAEVEEAYGLPFISGVDFGDWVYYGKVLPYTRSRAVIIF